MIGALRKIFGAQSDLALVVGLVLILLVLFAPVPPWLLDFLLVANLSFALLLLLLTVYMEKPLGFSTFPSLLLIATLFRLGLNVSATRLILSDAYAGDVISAIGSHVVAGNYVVGLIVFLILIVVQYVVVTNGAQRVAEVSARFTLDSMLSQSEPRIDQAGNVWDGDKQIGTLRVVRAPAEANMTSLGNGLYTCDQPLQELEMPRLRQGYVEASNVVPMREMVRLIETMPQMKGAGTTLAYIFPGLPYWAGVVLVGAVITLNVALGGMKGITLVQAFQYWAKMFAISVPVFVLMIQGTRTLRAYREGLPRWRPAKHEPFDELEP